MLFSLPRRAATLAAPLRCFLVGFAARAFPPEFPERSGGTALVAWPPWTPRHAPVVAKTLKKGWA